MTNNTTMDERLETWISRQHGTAGWQTKLARFIENEISLALQKEREEIHTTINRDFHKIYALGYTAAKAKMLSLIAQK